MGLFATLISNQAEIASVLGQLGLVLGALAAAIKAQPLTGDRRPYEFALSAARAVAAVVQKGDPQRANPGAQGEDAEAFPGSTLAGTAGPDGPGRT